MVVVVSGEGGRGGERERSRFEARGLAGRRRAGGCRQIFLRGKKLQRRQPGLLEFTACMATQFSLDFPSASQICLVAPWSFLSPDLARRTTRLLPSEDSSRRPNLIARRNQKNRTQQEDQKKKKKEGASVRLIYWRRGRGGREGETAK